MQLLGDQDYLRFAKGAKSAQTHRSVVVRQLLYERPMDSQRLADVDRFFTYHLRNVAARLERNTQRAIQRQKAERRETIHREALLEERQSEPPRRR